MTKTLTFAICLLSATTFTFPALAAGEGTLQLFVSKAEQSLKVYDGGRVVATSRVSTGKPGYSTPSGIFSILEKRRYHESNLYSNAPMPWMQRITWSGVALHESNSVPKYPASHGCVRLPRDFAKTLYQMTERGMHVIITDEPVVPALISHPTLFRPEIPAGDGQLLSDADLRTSTVDGGPAPVEVAMIKEPTEGASDPSAVLEDVPPIRILITRRGLRETVVDVQTLLNDLGFDSGVVDGIVGRRTVSAINGFKRWKGLDTNGEALTAEFLKLLYTSAGKGEPPLGQIMVRQKFKPVFEAPISISDPQTALGTHFIEATEVNRLAGTAEWHAVTLENHLSDATMKRLGIVTPADDTAIFTVANALDRITIPTPIRKKIDLMLGEGSSITISDTGVGPQTGPGTDFITITRKPPRN